MSLKVRHQGALRTITRLSVRAGGVLRQLRTLKVMDGDELRLVASFAPPMSVVANPAHVYGSGGGAKASMVESDLTTAMVTGGQAPYTYSWARLSGNSQIEASAPTSATTNFRRNLYHTTVSGIWRCTVTDALGTSATCDVEISLEHLSF